MMKIGDDEGHRYNEREHNLGVFFSKQGHLSSGKLTVREQV